MPTPTTRNGFRKPDVGGDTNTWGSNLNSAVFDLVDASLDGWTEISTSGATTLTSNQYVANQARQRCLHYSASTSGTLTIPPVEKNYIVWAENADVTLTTGGPVTATIKAGDIATVICDGSDCHKVQSNDFNGAEIVDIATPTTNNSAATKAYVDGIAFETTGALPGQNVGTTYNATFSDGSDASWRRALPQSTASNVGKVLKSTGVDGYPETSSTYDWDSWQGAFFKTANYPVVSTDRGTILLCSDTITLSLAAAATLGSKFYCRVVNVGTGLITIDPNGSETVTVAGGSAKTSIVLIPSEGVDLFCDGSNWVAVVSQSAGAGPHLYVTEGTNPSYSNNTWVKRRLSVFEINDLGASTSSGQITNVPPGKYRAEILSSGNLTDFISSRLYNATTASEIFHSEHGLGVAFNPSTGTAGFSRGVFAFTLSATSSLELQSYAANTAANGGAWLTSGGTTPFNKTASVWLTRISP